jgi:hypothetical protein
MPIVFIHGVNVRNTGSYQKNEAVRDRLIRRLILDPLSRTKPSMENMGIANPYWGGYGVSFRWNHASLPQVKFLEALGGEELATPQADIDISSTVHELAGAGNDSNLEPLGVSDQSFRQAALENQARFTETIVSPIILSEMPFDPEEATAARAAEQEAILLLAVRDVGRDNTLRLRIGHAVSNEQVIDILKDATIKRFEELLVENEPASAGVQHGGNDLEPLGWAADLRDKLKDRIGEIFDRAVNSPGRATTVAALEGFRNGLNANVTQFLGDVFVYLIERDLNTGGKPYGPIVAAVLDALNQTRKPDATAAQTPKETSDEPLIVITHSMGGNILYDILTHYQPATIVDAWISVASQVGEFEEMKLFKSSDKTIAHPQTVDLLSGKVKHWLNVYDPADILSFLAKPVFRGVDEDLKFSTGASALKAHGTYFNRPSFYDAVRSWLEKVL